MAGGRPTKYNKQMQDKADSYVDGGFADVGDVVPSRAGLALELGVSRSTLQEWEKEHDRFSVTLDRLKWFQERLSLNGGLKGDMNSTIVKLLLANHGYSDRVAQDVTSSDGSMKGVDRVQIEVVGSEDSEQ
ncbi:DNA-packaging protein [Spiribacter sp. 390]|uniref:DNA-packaging protein n=1 Tax=Spiribacter pallidus TaxID=1987936 RepID=A0ABV3TE58_9GAMM